MSDQSVAGGSPSKIDDILSEYQGLEMQLSDPELHNDASAARKVSKRFSELQPVIQTYNAVVQAREDHEVAAEMAGEDAEFAAEANGYTATRHQREVGTGYFDLIAQIAAGGDSSTTALAESTEAAQFVQAA